ncbi:hypothetical protein CMV_004032 [Castanea mollissima]|uniref:DUF4283 domain-containing protein n=1 Tax=Castanea mollissima TaxID=60419 RepID=A0A8J4W567_9ROSI|nr:hypothetical protein CMV_004032 [Castanea mollissima]
MARSNKKVKDIHRPKFNGGSREDSPSLGFHNIEFSSGGSFKDKLVGDLPRVYVEVFEFESLMEEVVESDCENEEDANQNRVGWVNVRLSKETKQRIRGPWSRAIIVMLVGRSVGFAYLKSRLSQRWRPSAKMDCVDLGYGFFLVKFFSKEDLDAVLMKGPWFIGDHFLSIRPWEPFFKPLMANVSLIAVWIRLCELPIELYDAEVLKQIGESIGKVLRIVSHMAMEARGKYARLCIQIDVNKPQVEACPYIIRKEKESLSPTEEVEKSCSDVSREKHVEQPTLSVQYMGELVKKDSHYGPWMVVSKKMYGRKGTKAGGSKDSTKKSTWHSSVQLPPRNPEWGKKAVARNSSAKTKFRTANNPLSNILDANITSLYSDRASPSSRETNESSSSPFEFMASAIADLELHGDNDNAHVPVFSPSSIADFSKDFGTIEMLNNFDITTARFVS